MKDMKIAVIGKGKTGKYVTSILEEKNISFEVFDSQNTVSVEKLENFTHSIIFVPGEVFINLIPILLNSKVGVITGATGFTWPENIESQIIEKKLTWIHSTNFALGMNLVKQMINVLSKANQLFEKYEFSIHEVHHTKKLDAPSGTAKSWASWLNSPSTITSDRIGDIVGDHSLTLKTSNEEITLRHQALDRSIFATGAIWTLQKFHKLKPGLNQFSKFSLEQLLSEQ